MARYLNGLRYNIQDEISLMTPKTVEACFQMAIREKEKVEMRQEKTARGRGNTSRGRGTFSTPK